MGDKRLIDNEWMTIDECYEKHKKFVYRTVNKFFKVAQVNGLDRQELLSIAGMGLAKAFNRFDQDLGYKFITYAASTMENEIKHYFRGFSKAIYFPLSIKELAREITKHGIGYEENTEIARILEADIQDVRDALEFLTLDPKSFESPISMNDENKHDLHSIIGESEDYDTKLHRESFVNSLSERERHLVSMKLRDKTQYEIASELGVSQPQASRIMRNIKKKYQDYNKGEIA